MMYLRGHAAAATLALKRVQQPIKVRFFYCYDYFRRYNMDLLCLRLFIILKH